MKHHITWLILLTYSVYERISLVHGKQNVRNNWFLHLIKNLWCSFRVFLMMLFVWSCVFGKKNMWYLVLFNTVSTIIVVAINYKVDYLNFKKLILSKYYNVMDNCENHLNFGQIIIRLCYLRTWFLTFDKFRTIIRRQNCTYAVYIKW